MESEFIINDYYGSSNIEALMLGVPFVMFNAAEIIVHNPNIKELRNEMGKKGIYFESGKDLSKELCKHESVIYWLHSKQIQNLYERYIKVMTGVETLKKENAVDKWVEEFLEDC